MLINILKNEINIRLIEVIYFIILLLNILVKQSNETNINLINKILNNHFKLGKIKTAF